MHRRILLLIFTLFIGVVGVFISQAEASSQPPATQSSPPDASSMTRTTPADRQAAAARARAA
mgnify:FL=1